LSGFWCHRNITLAEALLGFKMEVKHLDGRAIEIVRDEITIPGQDHEAGVPITFRCTNVAEGVAGLSYTK
jgi:hypothetical protein